MGAAIQYSINGEMLFPRQVEEKYGIKWNSLYARMDLYGDTAEQALDRLLHPLPRTKPKEKPVKKKHKGRKPWREVRDTEIYLIKRAKCEHCKYAIGDQGGNVSLLTCNYILDTGHMRGCDPRDCEHWKEPGGRTKRTNGGTR